MSNQQIMEEPNVKKSNSGVVRVALLMIGIIGVLFALDKLFTLMF